MIMQYWRSVKSFLVVNRHSLIEIMDLQLVEKEARMTMMRKFKIIDKVRTKRRLVLRKAGNPNFQE